MDSESQVFYITIATIGAGLIVACIKYGYKSKCSEVNLGCISIKRNVEVESKYDIEHPIKEEDIDIEKNEIK